MVCLQITKKIRNRPQKFLPIPYFRRRRMLMSLFVCSLNSGSNGNCYYVGNDRDAILVDAGISCREIEKRLFNRGLSIKNIRALFISHEHSDHINGARVLSKKYNLPVYITPQTLTYSQLNINSTLVKHLSANTPISIGSLNVSAFIKYHDACDPHSFIVQSNGIQVGVFTDIGKVCDNLIYHFKQCHAAFLESNYDEEMLDNGRYPYHLKRRIKGGLGHLSNSQALQLCLQHKPPFMSHLFLSHLSKENNCPNLVKQLFSNNIRNIEIVIASRYEPTNVYQISTKKVSLKKTCIPQQLSLSF